MARAFGLKRASSAPSDAGRTRTPFIRYGFALLLVMCTIWSIDLTSPALPEIKNGFGLSAAQAGLIISFLYIGRLLGNLPAARMLETVGSPIAASIGGAMVVAGASICMLAPGAEVLYLGRILQGAGISLLVNAGLRSILFARPGRGAAMTQYGLAATCGGVLGLQTGGLLTGQFGWRAIFLMAAILGVVLTILPLISSRVSQRANRSAAPAAAQSASAPVPLRTYLPPLAVNFLIFCNYSIWVILPLYAQHEFDASPEMTANLLLIITITHLAVAIPVNRAIQRFGSGRVLLFAVLLAAGGTVGVLAATSIWLMAVPLVFYGAGMVGSVNSAGDIVLHRGGAGAKAVGSLRQTSDLGLVIGPILAGTIVDRFSYDAPFIFFPAVMLCVIVAGIAVPGVLTARNAPEAA